MDQMLQYQVAKAYYLDNLGQQEIANRFGLSRPKVSRVLKEARESGMVQITITPPVDITPDFLPQQLQRLLNIDQVDVVDTLSVSADSLAQRLQFLVVFAAKKVPALLGSARYVGLGWGNTIYQTVMGMDFRSGPSDVCFVPLVGNAGLSDPAYQTNAIVERAAEKFKGKRLFLNTPAFVTEPSVRQFLLSEDKMSEMRQMWEKLDAAVFGLGVSLKNASVIMDAIGSADFVQTILAKEPVGDILGHYFTRDGRFCLGKKDALGITISRDVFRKIPKRICVVMGEEKVDAILAANQMGAYTHLITDTYTAMELIRRGSR